MSFLYHFLLHLSFSALIFTTIHVQSSTISDIYALKSFKASIKPSTIPSYSCLGSWNFTTNPCSTPHITHFTCGLYCTNNRITQITLDSAGYSGTLSPLISKLTQLTHLDLSDNKFFGPIPPLSPLTNLQILTLRSNSFSTSIPPSLTNLKSLFSLDLSHNSLSGSLPNLYSLTNLKRLDLSFNKFTGPIPTLPPNLNELALKSNSLSGYLSKSSFNSLTQLEVIELSENTLTGKIQPWFFLLPSLQQVNLAKNGFASVEIWKPSNYSDLIAVDIGYNKLQGYLPINFADYPLLSSLDLRYNNLRGPIPWEYSKKESLTRLYLDGNFLNGSPPNVFFSGGSGVSGSLGDNCLQRCPVSSILCGKSQKPTSICRQAYNGKPRL